MDGLGVKQFCLNWFGHFACLRMAILVHGFLCGYDREFCNVFEDLCAFVLLGLHPIFIQMSKSQTFLCVTDTINTYYYYHCCCCYI